MFTSVEQFTASWSHESASTQRVMDALTDASLNQKITPDHRSLGQLAWHLTTTVHEMMSRTGLEFQPVEGGEHAPAPASAQAIADAYRSQRNALLEAVQAQWKDADLTRTSSMYGEEWPNGLTLRVLIQHEVHHRGQMTVLMRQAGLRVPDIYGPTREDWIERGMTPLV
ncbi:DinB family protein [Paenibacillus sp. OAS669]|uniref:DinB family protein n=1 Tax=Paenibacillus sp. OAS669 TaxID=2663821 RepID=UPI00178A9480|nr:DinB family protein [Paenibacillus sp. OAS669]MBE1444057.1 putative damage-inducible protein DinB [Paenibacillus sp. OAS669]